MNAPPSYVNWRRAERGVESSGWFEFPIVGDANIVGQISNGFGPYKLLNPVADPSAHGFAPVIIVRVDNHLSQEPEDYARPMQETDEAWFHGGWQQDEIAALISLGLGIRARKAGVTREFRRGDDDATGRPVGWDRARDPQTLMAPRKILRRVTGVHSLEEVFQFALYPQSSPALAVSLIRAARLYQDALWISDVEPNLSWLLLTSAVETAAGFWSAAEAPPLERLRASRPDLERILLEAGGEQHALAVADQIAPYMGSTKRFTDFLLTFLPNAPQPRPAEVASLPWDDKRALKRVFTVVYKYRSRALHAGTPFPIPMCEPSFRLGDDEAFAEIPLGGATRTLGATWVHRDVPLLLDTFEYIARGAILNWWHHSVQTNRMDIRIDECDNDQR